MGRVQLTTYLSDSEQMEDWKIIKAHYTNVPDTVILRELIQEKATGLRGSSAGRQSFGTLLERMNSLERKLDRLIESLNVEVDY